jgi:hypothetical protein
LKDKVSIGKDTICRVIGIKLKEEPQSYKWKNYYGRKVWTVNTSDVEWVQCEHINKTGTLIQLQAQIDQLRLTLDSLPKTKRTVTELVQIDQLRSTLDSLPKTKRSVTDPNIQSYLESLTKTLSTEIYNHKIKLEPESFSTKVSLKEFYTSTKFKCKMKQFPANINNATTGHKLQDLSKDVIILAL